MIITFSENIYWVSPALEAMRWAVFSDRLCFQWSLESPQCFFSLVAPVKYVYLSDVTTLYAMGWHYLLNEAFSYAIYSNPYNMLISPSILLILFSILLSSITLSFSFLPCTHLLCFSYPTSVWHLSPPIHGLK